MKNTISSLKFFQDKDILSIEEIKTQHGGNDLFRVVTKNGDYLVRRIDRGEGDVSMEFRIAELAASIGVAPHVHCFDTQNSVMANEWIEGEHKKKLLAEEIVSLANVLNRLHAINVADQDISSTDLHSIVDADTEDIVYAFAFVGRQSKDLGLCHNDLNPHNIIWSDDGLALIDFEYAGVNDVYFDLAGVSVEFGLSSIGEQILMEEYFSDTPFYMEKLHAYKVIYDALRRQWLENHTP